MSLMCVSSEVVVLECVGWAGWTEQGFGYMIQVEDVGALGLLVWLGCDRLV